MKKIPHVLFILFIVLLFSPQSGFCGDEYYYIEVSVKKCRMQLYRIQPDGKRILSKEYIVATAMPKVARPRGRGTITKIEFDPWWYPTPQTRSYFKRKKRIRLASAVPPGHKQNFMGPFKIHLSHKTCYGAIYRIHGNNNPVQIGKRVTGGCTRMHNDEGVELARILKEGTEVNFI